MSEPLQTFRWITPEGTNTERPLLQLRVGLEGDGYGNYKEVWHTVPTVVVQRWEFEREKNGQMG